MDQALPINLTVKPQTEGKGKRADIDIEQDAIKEYHDDLRSRFKYYIADPPLTIKELEIIEAYNRPRATAHDIYVYEETVADRYEIDFQAAQDDNDKTLLLMRSKKKHAGYELGPHEFTLTYSPKWGLDDDQARTAMKLAIQRLVKYYKEEIIEFRAIGEFASQSHVHCLYHLKGGLSITGKNFKRAYPWWNTKIKTGPTGHQGGHHRLVQNLANFRAYIDKEVETAWLNIKITESPIDDPN